MITDATITILGVIVVLVTTVGYYTMHKRQAGRSLYALLVVFSLMHLIGDGILRSSISEPLQISMKTLNVLGVLVYMVYVIGLIGVLQAAFDIIWLMTRESSSGGVWVAVHLPALVVVVIAGVVGDTLMLPVIKYMPLLYTLVLFFALVWFFEKLDRGTKVGLIVTMAGCVLYFVSNDILHITMLPMMVPVLLLTMGMSYGGGVVVYEEETAYAGEAVRDGETVARAGAEGESAEIGASGTSADSATTAGADIELSELERMMMERADKAVERLELDESGRDQSASAGSDLAEGQGDIAVAGDLSKDSDNGVGGISDDAEGSFTSFRMTGEGNKIESGVGQSDRERKSLATGMRMVEPSPMEQLEAATVLTAESQDKTDDAVQMLQQVDETVLDVLHSRPLILEKDLNEFYHRMKEAMGNKDHDTCLEILSEMSDYRISGIHLTRYERIRHAVMDEEWKTVEKELRDF